MDTEEIPLMVTMEIMGQKISALVYVTKEQDEKIALLMRDNPEMKLIEAVKKVQKW